MQASSCQRLPALHTLVLLALFACGLVIQPVASALGELHGSLAHGEGISAHAGHVDVPHGDAHADHDEDDMAHVLLHVAHCCGHAQGLPANELVALTAPAANLPFLMPDTASPSPRIAVTLRPPIRA